MSMCVLCTVFVNCDLNFFVHLMKFKSFLSQIPLEAAYLGNVIGFGCMTVCVYKCLFVMRVFISIDIIFFNESCDPYTEDS